MGDQSGAIHIWDLKTDHNEQLIPEPEVSITSAHIDPDASYMAAVNSTVSPGPPSHCSLWVGLFCGCPSDPQPCSPASPFLSSNSSPVPKPEAWGSPTPLTAQCGPHSRLTLPPLVSPSLSASLPPPCHHLICFLVPVVVAAAAGPVAALPPAPPWPQSLPVCCQNTPSSASLYPTFLGGCVALPAMVWPLTSCIQTHFLPITPMKSVNHLSHDVH